MNEHVTNYEVAVSLLGSKLGLISRARREEMAKSTPDPEKLKQLEHEHARVWKERNKLRLDNHEAVAEVLRVYGPQVKKDLELAA